MQRLLGASTGGSTHLGIRLGLRLGDVRNERQARPFVGYRAARASVARTRSSMHTSAAIYGETAHALTSYINYS